MLKKRVQDPKAKRAAILASAARLFAQQGYETTSIAAIAGDAGVAVGSVYRQFSDKVAVLSALHHDLEHDLITVMETVWAQDLPYPDRFRPMFAALFAALTEIHAMMPILAMTKELVGSEGYAPGNAMIAAIRRMYFDGVEKGALRSYPPEIMPSILHGMVNGGLSAWAANPSKAAEENIVSTLTDVARAIAKI